MTRLLRAQVVMWDVRAQKTPVARSPLFSPSSGTQKEFRVQGSGNRVQDLGFRA